MKTLKFEGKATLSKVQDRIVVEYVDFKESDFDALISKMEAVLKDKLFKEYVTMFPEYNRLKSILEKESKEIRKAKEQLKRNSGF